MKREINILWIEDNLSKSVKDFQEKVKEIISKSLYVVHFHDENRIPCIDFKKNRCVDCPEISSCKRNILRDKRIDLIFSDNNLGNGIEGIDFLTKYRENGDYKYYILYSNIDEIDIVKKITGKLKENRKIHLFSNFDFISMNNWEERIEDTVKAFLNNRSKMEELRNIYIVENSLIEDALKNKKFTGNYKELINTYCSQNGVNKSLKNLWHKVRMDRNVLAHGKISYKDGYNEAIDKKGKKVSEEQYEEKMEALKDLTDTIKLKDQTFYV